jgi:hypothetical protein
LTAQRFAPLARVLQLQVGWNLWTSDDVDIALEVSSPISDEPRILLDVNLVVAVQVGRRAADLNGGFNEGRTDRGS